MSPGAGEEDRAARSTAGDTRVSTEPHVGVGGWSWGRSCVLLALCRGSSMDWQRWEAGSPAEGGERR